ncbi:MAG: DEAD/DEAH box helicase [Acidimicrobiia bacterium]
MTAPTTPVASWQLDLWVEAEADGAATPDELAALEADRPSWRAALLRLLRESEAHLASARSLQGAERNQVLADAQDDLVRFQAAWNRFEGIEEHDEPVADVKTSSARSNAARDEPIEPGVLELQASWEPGRVVAWGGGPGHPAADRAGVKAMLAGSGAPSAPWSEHASVVLPGGEAADAVAAPVGEILGWLVAAGAGQVDDVAPSVRWLGRVAIWAVDLTARGAMVPLLRQRRRRTGAARGPNASFSVRWTPALVDSNRLHDIAREMPGSVAAVDPSVDARALTRSALTGMVDAICRDSARRIEVPAAPPNVRTAADVTEAFLARLDGSAFDAPLRVANDLVERAEAWARPATRDHTALVVRLDPPDRGDAWELAVFAPANKVSGAPANKDASAAPSTLVPIEHAIVNSPAQRRELDEQLSRLERMLPVLLRAGSTRRGQVVLSQDEAWELMAETGPRLAAAGFDVRVPELTMRSPSPTLRVFAEASDSVVGASQLADVRWSAVFGDVELTAAEIAALARDARPMVRSGGHWVAIDHADLDAAAAALAERAHTTQLTGADMLRLALGLEGSPLAGGVSVEGGGWAADLLASAERLNGEPAAPPKGFVGELRSYQGEALAWLGFLDAAGIGGCLALDMGLGKTPTMLAHLLARKASGPSLVIAPPAVVGNWAAEAARFTPDLRVVVHHGAGRASADRIAAEITDADVVITTYGTAVRDVAALEQVGWARVVLDEAQAIKNPANDTAQQLRRIPATIRVALTGTPIENGLGDLWAILDYANPGLVGPRPQFIAQLSGNGSSATENAAAPSDGDVHSIESPVVEGKPPTPALINTAERALRALNGILVFRRTKLEPEIQAELPDKIDELDHCAMSPEQIGLYQAVLDKLVLTQDLPDGEEPRKGQILAAITALKQICNHPAAYQDDDLPLAGRSGKLARLEEIIDTVYAAGERMLIFTHFAEWGVKLAAYLSERMGTTIECYHGGLTRGTRDRIIEDFQRGEGAGALVLSLKAGGTGLNLTAANHVVLYDRWWNPAVEDQARDRAWRIGQQHTVISHRLVCPGTVDERVEEVVAGKRRIADMVLPKSSSIADLDADQLRAALGIRPDAVLTDDGSEPAFDVEMA